MDADEVEREEVEAAPTLHGSPTSSRTRQVRRVNRRSVVRTVRLVRLDVAGRHQFAIGLPGDGDFLTPYMSPGNSASPSGYCRTA